MPAQQTRPLGNAQGPQTQSAGPAQSPHASTSTSTSTATAPPVSSGANPNELVDGSGAATTRHERPSIDDAFNNDNSMEIAASTPTAMTVKILHGATNPLSVGCPLESALYSVINSSPNSTPADPALHNITTKTGDSDTPGENTSVMAENTLYIDGAPNQADVHQVGFADCYFEASVVNVINQNPAHIHSMVSGNHAACTVNLFTYDGTQWQPWSYSTDASLAYRIDSAGDRQGLLGAGFRLADLPTISEWWVEDRGGELVVCRRETYEAALWAPVLEKAYAAYIEANGQYGGYAPQNAHTGAGYTAINGGIAQYSYLIMYGNGATVDFNGMTYTPGADMVAANLGAIRNLLQVSGDGMGANQQFMMTACISPDTSVTRLGQLVTYILGTRQVNQYPTLKVHLQRLQNNISAWTTATTADKTKKRDIVIQGARGLATPGNWPLLHSDNAPKEYRDLNELSNVVMHLGSDHSTGQRYTYAWHSYSVQGAAFQDADGAELKVTLANLSTISPKIDPTRSKVHMRNPHGTNVPNEDAATDPPDQNDGVFDMTLDQFFRNFATQQFGTVNT